MAPNAPCGSGTEKHMPGEYKQQVAYGLPEVPQPCVFCCQVCCCEAAAAFVGAHGHTPAGSKLQAAAFYKHLTGHCAEETNLADLHDLDVQREEAVVNTAAAAAAANTADHLHRCWVVGVDSLIYYETHSKLADTSMRSRGHENLALLGGPLSEVCARQAKSCRNAAYSKVCTLARLPWTDTTAMPKHRFVPL